MTRATSAQLSPERVAKAARFGAWMALSAALLGWMFDGVEIGLFPLVARPALKELLHTTHDGLVGTWLGVATAVFLVGAATGGVFFGWLGDRIGRVRSMMLSVLAYALFTGLCGLATSVWQVAAWRFLAAMGMGGEWSLGVALVNEIWPDRSRAFLSGLIGAAANVGFLLIALFGLGLNAFMPNLQHAMLTVGLPASTTAWLTGNHGWRILMLAGATPALLSFVIQMFVPESEKWEKEKGKGTTSRWATRDLLGVFAGALGCIGIVYLWAVPNAILLRISGTAAGLAVAALGFLYPVVRYLQRSERAGLIPAGEVGPTVGRMMAAALLGGVALLGTWGSIQWAPTWADQMTHGQVDVREWTQIASAIGAILGSIGAAMMGEWLGRRVTYVLLCIGSLASSLILFQLNSHYGAAFLFWVFTAGAITAAFYGWFPLFFPELFRTRIRATAQGFSYNFGRIIAAIGVLQTGYLTKEVFRENYPAACSVMSLIYIVGVLAIWLVPETKGKPLPE